MKIINFKEKDYILYFIILNQLINRFIHLTNNCVQINDKNFTKSDIPGNMWNSQQFTEYLKVNKFNYRASATTKTSSKRKYSLPWKAASYIL